MEKIKLTEELERLISRGQYNGQDDKLKDVITNDGVCRNIFADDDSFDAVSEFTVDMLALLLGYMAVRLGEFNDPNEYIHTISKFAALFDIDSSSYYDEEKHDFDLERLVYDIATKNYEGYWNYDEISKHPEELELFTKVYNNDIQTLLAAVAAGDRSIAMQILNPKTMLFYSSKLIAKKPENEEEEMKMVAKLETMNDLSVILAKAIGLYGEGDKDKLFLDSIKDNPINNIMDPDSILKLSKTLMSIFNGYLDSQAEEDGPFPVFNLLSQEGHTFPLTFTPKVTEDFKFLVSVLTIKLFHDKKKFNADTFDSIFRPKDKELAEKVLAKLVESTQFKKDMVNYIDIFTESGDFDLFEALQNLTSVTNPCSLFLKRYENYIGFGELKETYETIRSIFAETKEQKIVFDAFESRLLFNLLYPAFMAFLVVSEDQEIYTEFLKKTREILHDNIGEEKRNVSLLAASYNVVADDEFFEICTLAQKIDELSDRAVEDCDIDELPDNVVKFDRNKLS